MATWALLARFDLGRPPVEPRVGGLLVLGLWLMLVGCAIWSVLSLRCHWLMKTALVMLVTVPIIGVAAYALLLGLQQLFHVERILFPLLGFWRDPD